MSEGSEDARIFVAQGNARTNKVDVKVEVRAFVELVNDEAESRVFWPNLGKAPPSPQHGLPVALERNGIWKAGALAFGAIDRLSSGSSWTNTRLSLTDDRMMLLKFKISYMESREKVEAVTYLIVSPAAPPVQLYARLPAHEHLALFQTRDEPEYGRLRLFDGPAVPITSQQIMDDALPHGEFEEYDPWGQGVQAHDRPRHDLPDGVAPMFHWEGVEVDDRDVMFTESASGGSKLLSIPKERRTRRLRPRKTRRS